jgi:hypothetical protein
VIRIIAVGMLLALGVEDSVAAAPDPPTNLSGTVVGSTVNLSWTPPGGGTPATSYLVEAALTAGGPVIASLPLAGTTASIPGVPNGTFFIRVRAWNTEGASPPSNEIRVTVGSACSTAPAPPASLTASVNGTLVALGWAAGSGGCPATGFLVRAGSAPGVVDLANLPVGNVTGLQATAPPGTYFISVVAQNAFGTSAPSNERAVTVSSSCTIPGAPIAFAVGSAGSTATMSWAPPTTGGTPTSYLLEAGTAPGLANLGSLSVGGVSFSASMPSSGTYYLRVKGQNACGVGPASNEQTLTTGCAMPGQPAPPSASVTGRTANISWAAVAGATSYRIAVGTVAGASNVLSTVVTGTTHQLTSLPNWTYFTRVTALNACGSGPASGESTFTVSSGGCGGLKC